MSFTASDLWSFIGIASCDTVCLMNSVKSQVSIGEWLTVCGEANSELAGILSEKVAALRREGAFTESDQMFIQKMSYSVAKSGFATSPERMELLRRLCQIYSIDVRPAQPTSHRKLIGPVVVAVKKVIFPVIKALLGPTFKHQKDFNAVVVMLLTDLCNEVQGRK